MRTEAKPLVLLLLVCVMPPAGPGRAEFPRHAGPYLGQKPPGERAELFAPGIVSTGHFEHSSPVFTPDLTEIYWSAIIEENGTTTARPIFFMKMIDGVWSRPEIPEFAKPFACTESPFISPDGKRLYFHASQTLRPEKAAIHYVDRVGDGWGEAVKMADPMNAARWTGQPTVSGNGTLYFAGDYRGDIGLFSSTPVGGRYQQAVPLDERFNSGQTDSTPFIAPDQSYLIFCSFRPGGSGSGDLYISFKGIDGTWGPVVNMGERINTEANERFPNVTPDGKYLFFNSTKRIPRATADAPGNGYGDVYWIDARIIEELKRSARKIE